MFVNQPRNCTIQLSPLSPYKHRKGPFMQKNNYYIGFSFVVKDILRKNFTNNVTSTNNVNEIYDIYLESQNYMTSLNLDENSNIQDALVNSAFSKTERAFNQITPMESIIAQFIESTNQLNLTNFFDLRAETISDQIKSVYMNNYNQILSNLNQNLFDYNEVNEFINENRNNALAELVKKKLADWNCFILK